MTNTAHPENLRLFGGLLVVGAVMGAVGNGLHPITTGDLSETAGTLAGHGYWMPLHVGIIITLVLLTAGLEGMVVRTKGTPGASMARVAMAITLVGVSLAVTSLALDGLALKTLADSWAAAPAGQADSLLQHFVTAKTVNTALWGTTVLVFFGFAMIAHGLAAHLSGIFPGWVAWGAWISGLGSVVAASLQIPSGGETRAGELLFTGTASLLAVWSFALGLRWWRRPRTLSPRRQPTPKRTPVTP